MAGARIQLKRATASSWTSNNPVLYAGEIGLETDTNKFKIGDGTTAYNSLPYFNGNLTGSSLNDLADVTIVSASNGDFLRWNGTAWINDAVNLSTDTVGNYMVDVAAGTGVTVTHTPGEGSTASVAIGQDVATSASVAFAQLTVNGQTNIGGHIIPSTTEAHDLGSASARFRDIYLSGTTIDLGGATITSDGTDISFSGGINVGGSANFVGDLTGNADTASTLETARTISLSGDLSGSVSFDGSADVTINATVEPNSVALGTDTTGNYVVDVVAGTGLSVSHTQGEGSTASVELNAVLDDLNDVSASTANVGEYLKWDGSAWVPDVVQLGAHTVGDYMANVVAGTGVTVTHTQAEGSTASIAIGQDVSTTASVTFANLTVSGDLTVNGTTTTLNTENLLVEDNVIVLNSNVTGAPSGTAGIEIERGTSSNVQLRWNETNDSWEITEDGTTYRNIAAGQDVETSSSVTFAAVTAPVIGNASTASALQTARAISLSGDLSGSVSFDGSANVTLNATVEPNSVALGTDTTGNYMTDVVAGTGVTVTHTPGEGSSASVAIGQDVATTASVTFAHVAADVTGDLTGNADTATTLETARAISLAGDLSGSVSFDGSQDVTITATVQPNSVALGTDTTGNYVSDVVAGTAITVTHTPGEGSSASIALNASLNDLNDVVVGAPEEFQTLAYDGIGWVPTYAPVVSYVRNAEATTLTTGTAVYLFGGTGDHASVKRADNSSDATSSKTVGLVGTAIASSNNGPIVTRGYVDGINTAAFSVGDVLWLGKNGALTTTKPSAPDHLVFIGVVVRSNANGIVYVATQNGYELEELHDVKVTGVANKDVLMWNSASSIWVNEQINLGTDTVGDYVQNLVAGTGVTLSNNSGEGSTPTVAIGQDVSTSASVVFYNLETTHDLTVGGNIFVSGSVVTENQTSLEIDDPFIYLNGSSSVTNVDLGIAGNYNDGTYRHAGIFRDATDGKFKFFDSYTPEPSNPIDTGHASYSPAPVVAETFESTVTTGTAPFTVASTTEVTNLHADTASSLHTARAISLGGDLSGSVSFDGSGDVTLTATVEPNSVALGTDTTGNYMVDLAEGTGVTIIHTPGEGSTASVSIGQSVATTASVTFAHVSADVTGNLTGDVTGNADTASSLETARAISLAGDLSGSVSFDGSGDVTLTATIGANSVALGTDTTGNFVNDITAGTGVTVTHTPGEGSSPTIAIGQAVGTSSSVTFAAVTAPLVGNASTASTLQTARAISLAGDLSGSASFDGSQDVSITATVQPNSVALGTDTTGNYVSYLQAGTGVTITGATPAEGGTPTIEIGQAVGTSNNVTFASVSVTASATIGTNLTVNGDLTVNGTTTTVNTETINLADNVILLNSNETSTPSQNAGIEVERGTSTNVALRWNETSDKWEITEDGTTYYDIATTFYVDGQSITALDEIGDVNITSAASGDFLKWNGTAWVNDAIDLGTDTTGNYMVNVSAGTGISVSHTQGEGSTASVSLNATLDDLSNVSASAPSDGQFLKYVTASSAWVPAAIPTINNLDDVGDVTITSAASGDFLKWNGTAWVNDPLLSSANTFTNNTVISGTSSSAMLRITQTGTGNALLVEDSTNPDSTPFVVGADGKTVVGHTSPESEWYSSSNVGHRLYVADNQSANAGGGNIWSQRNNGGAGITIARSNGTNIGDRGTVATSDVIGTLQFAADDGASTGYIRVGRIQVTAEGTISTGIVPTNMTFCTGTTSGLDAERMRIDSSGRIAVGTTATSGSMFTIVNNTAANDALIIKGAASQSGYLTEWQNSSGTTLATIASDGSAQVAGIELGHATDTTITRVSAGKIAVEGVTVATTTDTRDVLVRFYMEVI